VGGAYFEASDSSEILGESGVSQALKADLNQSAQVSLGASAQKSSSDETLSEGVTNDEELPSYLFMHEQYAMFAQLMSELQLPKRITPTDENFYPTVAIQALMRIFCDPDLALHHGMVIQAVMFIFKSMGLGCIPFLKKVVPNMLYTVQTCVSNNLREAMLKQSARLSLIVCEHLRPYVAEIFDIVETFWAS